MSIIRYDISDVNRIKKRLSKPFATMFEKNMDKAGTLLLQAVRSTVPKKTGALAQSMSKVRLGKGSYGVKEGKFYGAILRAGSPPHPIYPRKKKALYWPDLAHPIAGVPRHPGFPPNPYPKQAIDKVKSEVHDLLKQFGQEVIK